MISNADPIGYFPGIRNIKVLEGDDYSGLYKDVLIDTRWSLLYAFFGGINGKVRWRFKDYD